MADVVDDATPALAEGQNSWLRPQSLVFTLLAEHLLERGLAVFTGSVVDVLGRVGIGEHATRSTLARMTRRGLLARQRAGRKIYYRMTPRCTAILEDGRERIWHTGVVDEGPATTWTVLTFSLPEAWQRQRYDLRARLTWAGFGALQNGVWLAPRAVDVTATIAELGLFDHVRVFQGAPAAPTDPASVIRAAFDLQTLADRYRGFCRRWSDANDAGSADPLVLTLRLSTQWLRIIRGDPRLPVQLLPPDWPAIEAQRLFRSLHDAHRPAAERIARLELDVIDAAP